MKNVITQPRSADWRRASTVSLAAAGVLCASLLPALSQAMTGVHTGPTGAFNALSLSDWKERSFSGNTQYELVQENGTRVLKGHTQGQASILYKEQTIDLSTQPIIHWSWKVDTTFADLDEKSRGGDDFPARLYVVVKTGFLPWDTLAINYVWSAHAPVNDGWTNPFTDKAHMIAVQSGPQHVGEWVSQSRNVADDFRQAFGVDIDSLDGYAVMVDGDNAGQEATAWFGEISFSSEP